MDLIELIIETHAKVHAAELAAKSKSPGAAWHELAQLHLMLNDQPELEAGGIGDTPPSGKT